MSLQYEPSEQAELHKAHLRADGVTLNPQPQTLNPDPKPSTLNPRP